MSDVGGVAWHPRDLTKVKASVKFTWLWVSRTKDNPYGCIGQAITQLNNKPPQSYWHAHDTINRYLSYNVTLKESCKTIQPAGVVATCTCNNTDSTNVKIKKQNCAC